MFYRYPRISSYNVHANLFSEFNPPSSPGETVIRFLVSAGMPVTQIYVSLRIPLSVYFTFFVSKPGRKVASLTIPEGDLLTAGVIYWSTKPDRLEMQAPWPGVVRHNELDTVCFCL